MNYGKINIVAGSAGILLASIGVLGFFVSAGFLLAGCTGLSPFKPFPNRPTIMSYFEVLSFEKTYGVSPPFRQEGGR